MIAGAMSQRAGEHRLADKAASVLYEKRLRQQAFDLWIERCRAQVGAALAALERDRAARTGEWSFGASIGHADIAVAMLRFVPEGHPGLIAMEVIRRCKRTSRRPNRRRRFRRFSSA